ncbi:MAG: hypothetical protein L0215_17005 [Gemmataceae bacterium]|nr:hypothetical protein [Gemmataceae bacterium]
MRSLVVSPTAQEPVCLKVRELLRAHVDPQGPLAASFANVERVLLQAQPQVVVVVLSPQPDRGIEILRQLRRLSSGHVLAVGQATDSRLILRALQEGADHYLDEADLESGLEAVLSRWQDRSETANGALGQVLGVLACAGGSGASTLAVNLAAAVARDFGACGLIDLKPGRGDLAPLLDLKPGFTLADACLNVGRLDRAMLEKMLARHPSGVQLLGAPQMFADIRVVSPQGVDQALTMARRLFPQVLVDLEDCFHEEQLVAFRQAKDVLLVCRLDFTSLRNARRILEYLRDQGISRIHCVINRYGQPGELPKDEAEDALGAKMLHYVPDDPKTINLSNNLGVPAVLKYPNSKVAQSIVQLARQLCERRKEKEQPPRILAAAAAIL